jgi:hypothetical protein
MEKKRFGTSPLIAAIQSKDLSAVQRILDAGAVLEESDIHGYPGLPLRTACFVGDVAITKELIKRGANLNAPTGDGPGAPIRLAMRAGHREIVALLLANHSPIPFGIDIPPHLYARADDLANPGRREREDRFLADFDPPPLPSNAATQSEPAAFEDDNMIEFVNSMTDNALQHTHPGITYDMDYSLLSRDIENQAGGWGKIDATEDAKVSGRRGRNI